MSLRSASRKPRPDDFSFIFFIFRGLAWSAHSHIAAHKPPNPLDAIGHGFAAARAKRHSVFLSCGRPALERCLAGLLLTHLRIGMLLCPATRLACSFVVRCAVQAGSGSARTGGAGDETTFSAMQGESRRDTWSPGAVEQSSAPGILWHNRPHFPAAACRAGQINHSCAHVPPWDCVVLLRLTCQRGSRLRGPYVRTAEPATLAACILGTAILDKPSQDEA